MIRTLYRIALAPAALLLAGAAPELGIETRDSMSWGGVTAPDWADSFGTAGTDWANHAIELRDGGVVATGFVNRVDGVANSDWDVVLRKYSTDGQVLWTRRIGGRGLDAGWAVRELADGRLAVAGFSSSGGGGGNDAYLLLTDAEGATLSEHWYGGGAEDRATDLVVAPDGGLLLVGQTESSGAGERDVFVVRTMRMAASCGGALMAGRGSTAASSPRRFRRAATSCRLDRQRGKRRLYADAYRRGGRAGLAPRHRGRTQRSQPRRRGARRRNDPVHRLHRQLGRERKRHLGDPLLARGRNGRR